MWANQEARTFCDENWHSLQQKNPSVGADQTPVGGGAPWPVWIPSGSFVAVVSDETDRTEALLPYLADAHYAGLPVGETRQEVYAFCADTSKPPFRLAQNGAAVLDMRDLMGWVNSRRDHVSLCRSEGEEPIPALLFLHWARERRFFQEPAVNKLLVEELSELCCAVVVVSRYMLDLTWAVRSHVDAVVCCGVENLKCIYHLYTQFGSVYHRENEFSRLVSRRERWTWIDNSKELPARLKPDSERGMYDVVFDSNEARQRFESQPGTRIPTSRLALEKPGAALVILPSAEPGGGGLQRLDVRAEFLAKVLRWHATQVDLEKSFSGVVEGETENFPRAVFRENASLAREIMDQMLKALTSPAEMATFERRSLGSWNSERDEYELPSWFDCLSAHCDSNSRPVEPVRKTDENAYPPTNAFGPLDFLNTNPLNTSNDEISTSNDKGCMEMMDLESIF